MVVRTDLAGSYFGFMKSDRKSARLHPSLLGADGNDVKSNIFGSDATSSSTQDIECKFSSSWTTSTCELPHGIIRQLAEGPDGLCGAADS